MTKSELDGERTMEKKFEGFNLTHSLALNDFFLISILSFQTVGHAIGLRRVYEPAPTMLE